MRRILLAALLLTPLVARAHVTADPAAAPAESYARIALRVPHGCAGAATIRVAVALPPSVTAARPMPKPRWRLATTLRALETPVPNGHGGWVREAVAEIVWEGGPLPDAHYDEFVVLLRLPALPGEILALPTVQGCEAGREVAWSEPPAPGAARPVPVIRLLPAARP